ncbi:RNA polymerase sigma-70 factor [Parasegetibacter sp. MAH-26]|uniref:RNA polymerase sigma-70 factor n=2 Tax=Pinibacter aurantiacus TaxID=2851599 RepID=A0A9E2S8W5_9BACT|nr:RNA polymerase sigma-70 factor [Pinibacter aurantiacus]
MTHDRLHIRELVERIAVHNDQQAYKQFFCMFQSRLRQFAYSVIKSHEIAEEITSDVFIKIWNKRVSLLKIDNIVLYLYVSVKNQSLNYLSQKSKENVFFSDEILVEMKSIYFDPEQLMITAEMMRRVQMAISTLPPKCRQIFKLVKEDGLRYKEVAELLGISLKTVEAQMSIALRRVAQSIHFDINTSVSSYLGK